MYAFVMNTVAVLLLLTFCNDDTLLCYDDASLCFDDASLCFDDVSSCSDGAFLSFYNASLCYYGTSLCNDDNKHYTAISHYKMNVWIHKFFKVVVAKGAGLRIHFEIT